MMNRKLADIVKGQKLVALAERETVQEACRYMWERRTGWEWRSTGSTTRPTWRNASADR
jgi:hypothetical protein